MVNCGPYEDCGWDEARWAREGDPRLPFGFVNARDPRYLLRPEAIESIFILYRVTGDEKLRDVAWAMFQGIMKSTKTEYANSAIADVTVEAETEKQDSMESFWLAETLKYVYLIFSPPDLISLDEFVLNTEHHTCGKRRIRPSAPTRERLPDLNVVLDAEHLAAQEEHAAGETGQVLALRDEGRAVLVNLQSSGKKQRRIRLASLDHWPEEDALRDDPHSSAVHLLVRIRTLAAAQEHEHLGQVLVKGIGQCTYCEAVIAEHTLIGKINHGRPHTRKEGVFLGAFEKGSYAVNGIIVFVFSSQLSEAREFHR
ncbi:Endoplasmic reticulum mannosyl-oligosaccharide 1-2-alpha-mannosidase [Apiospora arundinis]|uniref:alpha-1,2-Mannosidase n=1 Tax=Apiospora arundinis TaxID=335852 RepID=A0ABR2J3B8_9PEZI